MTSKWMDRYREWQKNSGTVGDGTDKTDKTPSGEVLSVLAVGVPPISPKFDTPERAAIAEDGGIPSVYAAAWAHLQADPPVGMDHTRWMQARDDAAAFLDKWGVAAARLDWPAHHLFEAPRGWIGGLVWEIRGGVVVALTDRQAIIAQGTRKLWFCIPPHTGHDRETRNG